MQQSDAFSGYHPLVNFLFFALVLGGTMFFLHPVSLCISLLGAGSYYAYLKGWQRSSFSFLLPMVFLAAILNPLFHHEGVTILTYLPSGNPLTLESILYGIAAGGMLLAVVLWFSCYTEVMTSDKFIYLFGRIFPALSLHLSMTLRFVPHYKAQFHAVREAQKCVGRDLSDGNLFSRMKHLATIFSIMVTWALENAIETADSMKSRGYGLPGRTAFSIYRFEKRDRLAILWLFFCGGMIGCGAVFGSMKWSYFPRLQGAALTPWTFSLQLIYLALCLTPVALDRREDWKWRHLKYEI